MKIFTIGFTKKSAEDFFGRLKKSGAHRLVDVRLNNKSQLAGFAKGRDLEYFLKSLCEMDYLYLPKLAPTKEILDGYKKSKGDWGEYEVKFRKLLTQRKIEEMDKEIFDGACLLCSEDTARHCHRRLVAEYLKKSWGDVEIIHL